MEEHTQDPEPVRHRPDHRQRKLGYGQPYPTGRDGHFYAINYIRTLFALSVAQRVKPAGLNLLILIASYEDQQRYTQAVEFTDVQLLPFLGVDAKTLILIRKRCIAAGWLHFEPGWPGVPSRYWTETPLNAQSTCWKFSSDFGSNFGSESGSNIGSNSGSENGCTIFPIPNPETAPTPTHKAGVSERVSDLDSKPEEAKPDNPEVLELGRELADLGVVQAIETACTALSRTSVENAREHVAHFRKFHGAWGATVLCYRLQSPNLAVQSPGGNWPDINAAWKSHLHALADYERKYGELIEGFSEEELAEQIPDRAAAEQRLRESGILSPSVRFMCLEAIATRVEFEERQRIEQAKAAEATTQRQLPSVDWEEAYGAQLDQLNDTQLAALISRIEDPGLMPRYGAKAKAMPLFRPALLAALHHTEQQQCN
ncbi:MAG: hypothetical protein U0941_29955 [Planctomycetaceae bacterium]